MYAESWGAVSFGRRQQDQSSLILEKSIAGVAGSGLLRKTILWLRMSTRPGAPPYSSTTTSDRYLKPSVLISGRSTEWQKSKPWKQTHPSRSESEKRVDRFCPVKGFTSRGQSSSLCKWRFGRFSFCHLWTVHSQSPGWLILPAARRWRWGPTVPTWSLFAERLQPLPWSLRSSHPGGRFGDMPGIHLTLLSAVINLSSPPPEQSRLVFKNSNIIYKKWNFHKRPCPPDNC